MAFALTAGMLSGCASSTGSAPESKETQTTAAATTEAEKAAETKAEETKATGGSGTLVGVAMPTKDLQRWNQDGSNMKKELEAAGYKVDLQYASNDVQTQVSQVENMISNGCQILVVASIDGSSLGEPLSQAKAMIWERSSNIVTASLF